MLALVEASAAARAVARSAYRAGARFVEIKYHDRHLTRARVELGPEDSLGWSAPWEINLFETMAAERAAYINIIGEFEPNLLDDLDGTKVGRARPRETFGLWTRLVSERKIAWTIVRAPTPAWATEVFGRPDVDALWDAVEKTLRTDRPDPAAAWRGPRPSRRDSGGADAAQVRCDPLPRPRHRPHRRPSSQRTVEIGEVRDRVRASARPQPADGRGVHDAGQEPRGGHRAMHPAAASRRRNSARPRVPVA